MEMVQKKERGRKREGREGSLRRPRTFKGRTYLSEDMTYRRPDFRSFKPSEIGTESATDELRWSFDFEKRR